MRLALVIGLAGCFIAHAAQADSVTVEDRTARSFGYVIGDTLERDITVSAEHALELEAGSLPPPGKHSSWLTLIDVHAKPAPGVRSTHQSVHLRYQIRNAPTQTRSIALPALTLRFRDSRTPVDVPIAQSHVTIAPIIPANAVAEVLPLRPDRSPQRLSLIPDVMRLILFTAGALALMTYGLLLPRLAWRRAPFARAYREIRRAARDIDSTRRYRQALRALHRAFDETAGRRVFADRLAEFFAERPWFTDLRESAETFLMMSQREFFADAVPAADRDFSWLLEFARACRSHEREAR